MKTKFILFTSFLFPVKTNNHGWLTYWEKKRLIKQLKNWHGYCYGDKDAQKGIDDNPFSDSDKWLSYDEAQYDRFVLNK